MNYSLICLTAYVLYLQPFACVQPTVCLQFYNCTNCFVISPSALFWGGGYSSFGVTFPPPMCFPSFETFWPLVLFGRGKGDNLKFSVSLVSFRALESPLLPSSHFLVCSAAVWAWAMRQGRSPIRAPTCPQSLERDSNPASMFRSQQPPSS